MPRPYRAGLRPSQAATVPRPRSTLRTSARRRDGPGTAAAGVDGCVGGRLAVRVRIRRVRRRHRVARASRHGPAAGAVWGAAAGAAGAARTPRGPRSGGPPRGPAAGRAATPPLFPTVPHGAGPYVPGRPHRPPNPDTNPYLRLPEELREPQDARPPAGAPSSATGTCTAPPRWPGRSNRRPGARRLVPGGHVRPRTTVRPRHLHRTRPGDRKDAADPTGGTPVPGRRVAPADLRAPVSAAQDVCHPPAMHCSPSAGRTGNAEGTG